MPPDRAAADSAAASGGIVDHRLMRLPEEVVQAVFQVPEHSVGVIEPAQDPWAWKRGATGPAGSPHCLAGQAVPEEVERQGPPGPQGPDKHWVA